MRASAAMGDGSSRLGRLLRSDHAGGWLFILPSVILVAVFGIAPIVWGLILSFQRAGLISPEREWVGFDNYRHIAEDDKAREAATNTIYYTILFVPISILLALFVAYALNRRIRFIRFYRLAVFLPVVTSTIATGIMFLWLFDKHFGLVNWMLGRSGSARWGSSRIPTRR